MQKNMFFENNVCNYYIDNIVFINDGYLKCINIMKEFLKSSTIYFTFFRKDGINLSGLERDIKTIHEYIKDNGKIESVYKNYNYLGYVKSLDKTWNLISDISKYYLESTFFNSNKLYDQFKNLYRKNQMKRNEFFIQNGIADIMFSFVDSGDFCISFDTNKYKITDIENVIMKNF